MVRPVHLVGSLPLDSSEESFRVACQQLGPLLSRVPDGETGNRWNWIGSQVSVMDRHPDLEALEPVRSLGRPENPRRPRMPHFGLRSSSEVLRSFDSTGYGDAARESYAVFVALRSQGVVPSGMRFQVSLPTPWASVRLYVRAPDRDAVFEAYRARFVADLDDLLENIPHEDLAIQWDVAVEVAEIEGALEDGRREPPERVAARIAELVPLTPREVETGVHLCYGDAGHAHFVQPRSLGAIVGLVNHIGRHLDRRLSWIHMPVPQDRSDDAYFAALTDLDPDVTERVHLGLLHLTDGPEGALRRMNAASARIADFGIATECGWGRYERTSTQALLDLHVAAAAM